VNSGCKKPTRFLVPKSAKSEFRRRVQGKSELPITYFFGGVRSVDVSKNIIGVRGIVLFLNEYRMYVLLTKTLNSDSVNSDFFHIGQRVTTEGESSLLLFFSMLVSHSTVCGYDGSVLAAVTSAISA
jgi:hypothetical protein